MSVSKISVFFVREMDWRDPHPSPLPAKEGTHWTPSLVSIIKRKEPLSNNPFRRHLSKAGNGPEMSKVSGCRGREVLIEEWE